MSKFLNINTDNTLGGSSSSDVAVPSQKAVKTYTDTGLSNKQDTLVSGTNIKTINNNSILGSGNLEISASVEIDNSTITLNTNDELQAVGVVDSRTNSPVIKTWTGTKAQYDAIVLKDNFTLYNITDESVGATDKVANIDLSNLSTNGNSAFNGQIAYGFTSLADGVSLTTSDVSYSLSSYLPDDDYNYMVLFRISREQNNNYQDYFSATIRTDYMEATAPTTYMRVANWNGVASSYRDIWHTEYIWLPVGTARFIKYVYVSGLASGGTYGIDCYAYYRLGRSLTSN